MSLTAAMKVPTNDTSCRRLRRFVFVPGGKMCNEQCVRVHFLGRKHEIKQVCAYVYMFKLRSKDKSVIYLFFVLLLTQTEGTVNCKVTF